MTRTYKALQLLHKPIHRERYGSSFSSSLIFVMFLRKQDGSITAVSTSDRRRIATIYLCNRGGCEVQNISPWEGKISKDEVPWGPWNNPRDILDYVPLCNTLCLYKDCQHRDRQTDHLFVWTNNIICNIIYGPRWMHPLLTMRMETVSSKQPFIQKMHRQRPLNWEGNDLFKQNIHQSNINRFFLQLTMESPREMGKNKNWDTLYWR